MTPIEYIPNFISTPNEMFHTLWNELAWVRTTLPRREYYWNADGLPYTYGKGNNAKTYQSQYLHPIISQLRDYLLEKTGTNFNVCFLNGYENSKDHLGWHSDDSPEMDNDSAIAIISLGADREIWFRPNDLHVESILILEYGDGIMDIDLLHQRRKLHKSPYKLLLGNGSLCLMLPNMQQTHQHRIPKCDRDCGPRISLTFRVYK